MKPCFVNGHGCVVGWTIPRRRAPSGQRLASAAAEWRAAEQDEGYLLRGARLTQFAEWAKESPVALTKQEQALLSASLAAREDRRVAERDRQLRELEAAHGWPRRKRRERRNRPNPLNGCVNGP